MVAATATAASGWPGLAGAQPAGNLDTGFWRRVENSFVIDRKMLYMNIGGTGSMPRHVLKNHDEYNRVVAKDPTFSYSITQMREDIAPSFGANADEFILTTNTTDGMCMSLNGTDWAPGDEIISTEHEHPGGNGPMSQQVLRKGVVIKRAILPVGVDAEPGEFVEAFRAQITNKTKAFCFSHIPYVTGTLLPAKLLCQLAIENGLMTIIDGAHVSGMMNVNFHDLGVDLYAASGHKWQCGPKGTGIWYVRNQRQSNPLELPMVWGVLSSQNAVGSRYDPNGAVRNIGSFLQSHGHTNDQEWQALTDSCKYWDEIGRQRIEDYVTGLSLYLKKRVSDTFGRRAVLNPDHPELVSGLTTFNPFRDQTSDAANTKIQEVVARLRDEYNIITAARSALSTDRLAYRSVRVSTHLFHNQRDIEKLMDAVIDLVNQMGDA